MRQKYVNSKSESNCLKKAYKLRNELGKKKGRAPTSKRREEEQGFHNGDGENGEKVGKRIKAENQGAKNIRDFS